MRRIALTLALAAGVVACEGRPAADDAAKAEHVVVDSTRKLMWQATLSPRPMSWDEATRYASDLNHAGHSDWRLPTAEELWSLVDTAGDYPFHIGSNPKGDPASLRLRPQYAPFLFKVPEKDDRVWSCSLVPRNDPEEEGKHAYVMRLANGHIYNGYNNLCYVLAVRDLRFELK